MKQTSKDQHGRVRMLVTLSLFIAIGSILIIYFEFPLLPSAPFLKYDPGDIPVILAAIIFGAGPGVMTAIVLAFIQSFLIHGSSGILGFFMNAIATGIFAFVVALITRKKKTVPRIIVALVIGTILMTIAMTIANFFVIPLVYYPNQYSLFDAAIIYLPSIGIFNLLKGLISGTLSFILYELLLSRKILEKIL